MPETGLSPRWPAVAAALLLSVAGLACNPLRVFFPSHHHDVQVPELPGDLGRPALLVFTKTNGYRHHEAIPAGLALFQEVAQRRGWSLFHTENGAVHNPEQLSRFDAVVWHQASGDLLDADQRAALRAFLEGGGGFVAIHGAGGDSSYDWSWYVEGLIGAQFIGHPMGPQFQVGTLQVEDGRHPATAGLPGRFEHEEEWYSFDRSVRERQGFRVLLSVDEASYSPRMRLLWNDDDLSMGDHPVVWHHCVGRGRVLFSALGHQAKAYAEPRHRALLEGALAWAARQEGEGCD